MELHCRRARVPIKSVVEVPTAAAQTWFEVAVNNHVLVAVVNRTDLGESLESGRRTVVSCKVVKHHTLETQRPTAQSLQPQMP